MLIWLWAGVAWAEDMEFFTGERGAGEPWRIRAETIAYDAGTHTYTAEGRVEIRQGDRRLTADRVQLNERTKIAVVQGHVVLVAGEDILTGRDGQFNLATRCGELHQARLFIKRNHFHVQSDLIRKTGEHSYYAEAATVTTCDADLPAWSFSTRTLTVVLEGYATGQHTLLRLAGVPVLYSPYGVLPVRTTRQSGLLVPFFSQQRTSGTVVEVPLYWAINNYADSTFYQNVISKRGYMQGVDFRYRGHQDAAGNLRYVYLNDGLNSAPTVNRYWAAGMVNQPLTDDIQFRGTLDRVSDYAYLDNFNYGNLGLNRYSRELLSEMGRDLEQQEVSTRVSTGLLSANLPWANLTGYSRYYQKLRPLDPSPYHRLPGLALRTLTLPLGEWPFSVGLDSSYTHFLQNQNPRQSGQKLDLHPQLMCGLQPLPGLSFQGRAGFRQTLFLMDQRLPGSPPGDHMSRQLFDAKVSLASLWYRDYGRGQATSWYRHSLRPEVTYWNMPRYPARRYPDFDPFDLGWVLPNTRNLPVREGDDPLGGVNAITYGFSSNLLKHWQNPQGQSMIQDLFWFRLTQSVFFNSSSMDLNGNDLPHHRVSDFYGEMELSPLRRLSLGLNMGISPYREGFNRANVQFKFFDAIRNNYISLGYLFLKDFANQFNAAAYIDLLRSVKTWVTYSHTFLTNNKMEQRYGLILQRQCWGISLTYTERPDDQRIGFTIIIPGLADRTAAPPLRTAGDRL